MKEVTQLQMTRQAMLYAWLKDNGKKQVDIARAMQVTEATISRWMRAKTIPEKRHQKLVQIGVPAELLPKPLDIPPGPTAKKANAAN